MFNISKKLKIISALIGVFSLVNIVYANNGEQTQIGSFSFKWFEISTPFDFKNFGVLNGLGYLLMFFVGWMILWTFWLGLKAAWKMIQSKGDSGEVEGAMAIGRELWRGTAIVFVWLGLYTAVSFWLGVGNLFQWPEVLTQCGDGTPYFQAEYNARQILRENGYTFNDDIEYQNLGYCCESLSAVQTLNSLSGLNVNIRTSSNALWGSNGTTSVVFTNITEDSEGWLLINAPDNQISQANLDRLRNSCRVIFD